MRRPSFNIVEIDRKREIILRRIDSFVSETLEGSRLDELAHALRGVLPSGATYDAIFESIRYLAGYRLEPLEAYRLAWRFAGNVPTLRVGKAVMPWSVQQQDEWVPLEVTRAILTKDYRGRPGYDFVFRVLAGSPCPLKIRMFWRAAATRFVSRQVGFSAPWGKYPFTRATQIVGLRLLGKIEAVLSKGRPAFHEIACPQSMINWNRSNVLKLRLRVDGAQCPNRWAHPCHRCAVGYDRCSVATHYRTYQKGFCSGCNQADRLFDSEDPSSHCIDCARKQRMRRIN